MDSLEQQVRNAREGDAHAFAEIVRTLSRSAVATARMITGDLHRGEEAAQDAFVAAWRKLADLREPRAFRAWFGCILARTASRARRAPHVTLEPGREPEVFPASSVGEELPAAALSLKPKYREVLALRYVGDLSYREIADALGLSQARVKSRLHDGRELLRDRLERRGRRKRR